MDVKQAVAAAKTQFIAAFADEGEQRPTLEEVWFDDSDKVWHITLGTRRRNPYGEDLTTGDDPLGLRASGFLRDPISYKEVRISDVDGKVVSIKIRLPERA